MGTSVLCPGFDSYDKNSRIYVFYFPTGKTVANGYDWTDVNQMVPT